MLLLHFLIKTSDISKNAIYIATCQWHLLPVNFEEFFERVASQAWEYKHNERWHDGNGFSHVRAALLGPSLSVPFINRQLTLGTWQQIVFLDFDNRRRSRKVIVQLLGD